MKSERTVPINDDLGEMLNWAVRYALGRRTYAVMDTCRYIKPLVPYLNNRTLWCFARDIKDQKDYGDSCDYQNWMDLLNIIETELSTRTANILDAIG